MYWMEPLGFLNRFVEALHALALFGYCYGESVHPGALGLITIYECV